MSNVPHRAVLACHPQTLGSAVEQIDARVAWREDGALALTYHLQGDLTCLRVPVPQPPRCGERLWEHTCFEAFVAVKGSPAYHEFNFAPSRQWAAYRFRRYREQVPAVIDDWVGGIAVQREGDIVQLDAAIAVDRFLGRRTHARLRLGLSAVVEDHDGAFSYWALKHPPGKPDFHNAEAFVLDIGWPDIAGELSGL